MFMINEQTLMDVCAAKLTPNVLHFNSVTERESIEYLSAIILEQLVNDNIH